MLNTRETIFLGMIAAVYAEFTHPGNAIAGDTTDLFEALTRLFEYADHVRRVEEAPDTMGPGWNTPAPASTADVLGVMRDAFERFEAGDSMEGLIIWSVPVYDDMPGFEDAEYELMARYRVGNLDGQGGLRVFTGAEP